MIYDRIKKLCKENGETITGLEKKLGFARGSLCKIDRNEPSSKRISAIADYFGVSFDYIRNGEEKETPTFSAEALEFLKLYENATPEVREFVRLGLIGGQRKP